MRSEAPPKPWYRARNVILLLLLLIVGTLVYQLRLALTSKPGASVDYAQKIVDLATSVKPGTPESDNAWGVLQQASERRRVALDAVAQAHPDYSSSAAIDFSLIYTPFDPADPAATGNAYGDQADFDSRRAMALATLEQYRKAGVFDSLAAATGKSVYIRPKPPARLLDLLIPELGVFRDFARANAARMRSARAAPGQAEFVAAFEQTMALGRLSTCDPIIISNLVGCAVDSIALNEVREAILDGALTPQTLRALQAALERQAAPQPMSLAIEGERISTLDIIQSTHTDDGDGDGRRIVSEWLKLKNSFGQGQTSGLSSLANLSATLYPSKKEITARSNEYYDLLVATARLSPNERKAMPSEPNPYMFVESLPWNYDILKLMAPALGRAIEAGDDLQVELAGLRLLLAIELYRAEQGKPPESLDALVPSFLPSLPRDPYAKDARFRYRLLETPDAQKRTYLLYSVSKDGQDNNGAENPGGKRAPYQPTSRVQYDFLINRRPMP